MPNQPAHRNTSDRGVAGYLVAACLAILFMFAAVSILSPSGVLAQEDPQSVNEAGEENSPQQPGDSGGSEEGGESDEENPDGPATDEAPTGDAGVGLDENGEPQQPGADDGPTGDATAGEENTPEGEAIEDGGGSSGDSGDSSDDSGGSSGDSGGLGTSIFTGIVSYIFGEPIETNARILIDLLTGWAFALPAPEGEIRDYYDRAASVVQPGAVTLLLITGLLMGVRGASYTTSYATQSALPKIALFIAGLSFFPEIMTYISNLSSGLAGLLIDQETMANALQRVMRNQALLGLSFIGGIVNLCVLILTFGLVLIAIAKSFIFAIFFIAGPLAMFLYPIRPLSGIAASWLKGTLACVAIPLLWAVEVWVGTAIIESPEMVFGDTFPGMGMFTAMTVLILTWIMIKTPFKVYEYCFYGYSSGNSFISSVGKSVAAGAIGSGLRGGGTK